MARPIKETPVLTGQDAKKFIKAVEDSQTKKVSVEKMARINRNYERLKAMAYGTLIIDFLKRLLTDSLTACRFLTVDAYSLALRPDSCRDLSTDTKLHRVPKL